MKNPRLIGIIAGVSFGAVFAAFYALASWAVCSGRTDCPGSWVPYLVGALVAWAVTAVVVAGGVIVAVKFYRLTKV